MLALFGVGVALREERVRQQRSLSEIASQTRISQRFLEAIENENFDRLPGLVFTRNFVRQYACVLNVDPEPMLARIPKVDISTVPMPDPPARVRQSAWDPHWTSALSTAVWCLLAVGAAGGGYWYFNHPRLRPALATTRATQAHSEPAAAPASPSPANSPNPVQADPALTNQASGLNPAAVPDSASGLNRAAVPDPPAAAEAETPAAESTSLPVQVVLTAREASWVQITADGRNAFTGTLHPNDSRSVAANTLVKVVAGNAGGVQISLNGKELDPIGPSGQVRTIRLTAEGPQSVVKTPPPAADPL